MDDKDQQQLCWPNFVPVAAGEREAVIMTNDDESCNMHEDDSIAVRDDKNGQGHRHCHSSPQIHLPLNDAAIATTPKRFSTPSPSLSSDFSNLSLKQSWRGDIGLALFSPLDITLDDTADCTLDETDSSMITMTSDSKTKSQTSRMRKNTRSITSTASESTWSVTGPCSSNSSAADSDDDFCENCDENDRSSRAKIGHDSEDEPVLLGYEDPSILASSPRLLTPTMMAQIRDEGLHCTQQIMRWHRPYSLSRDGDSFYSMMEKCKPYNHTIVVCKTRRGELLGGYADTPWRVGSRSFFGSGRAFLFASHPGMSREDKNSIDVRRKQSRNGPWNHQKGRQDAKANEKKDESVYIFKWTGNNNYSQVCSQDSEKLAMGGGGAFGFIVQDHFSRGSTGPCSTFNNPTLISGDDGCFDILDLEVYGLKSCLFG